MTTCRSDSETNAHTNFDERRRFLSAIVAGVSALII